MFPCVTKSLLPNALWTRAQRILRSIRGAFDLTSILVGVVVVGILTAGVFAAVFGVIPFAQDNASRQDLSAARTAQGVAKAKDGKYEGTEALKNAGYLSGTPRLAVGADADGTCWVGIVNSSSGAAFYTTSAATDPAPYTTAIDTGCLSTAEQKALAGSAGVIPAIEMTYASSWGKNNNGEAGNGTVTQSTVPTDVLSTDVLANKVLTTVSAGNNHSCAVAGGAAYCWGSNAKGQLGDGSTVNSTVPVAVTGLPANKTVTDVSAGQTHTCAVAGGAAYCWGDNLHGYLGNNSLTSSSLPVAVTGVLADKTVTDVSTGVFHTCAAAGGAAYCWGSNTQGQLGNDSTVNSSVPVTVTTTGVLADKTVTTVSSGGYHTCTDTGGAAYCWGYNSKGQLGDNSITQSNVPVTVTGALTGKTVTSVEAGIRHTCAVANGAAYCWGENAYGELGNNSTTQSNFPVAVSTEGVLFGKTVTAVSSGLGLSCAIADGAAYCWGSNPNGKLGNNSTTDSTVPTAVDTTGVLKEKTVTALDCGNNHTLALYK